MNEYTKSVLEILIGKIKEETPISQLTKYRLIRPFFFFFGISIASEFVDNYR